MIFQSSTFWVYVKLLMETTSFGGWFAESSALRHARFAILVVIVATITFLRLRNNPALSATSVSLLFVTFLVLVVTWTLEISGISS
jgi:hypothetical protein